MVPIREHLTEKNRFLSGIVQITSPPSPRANCTTFFGRQKRRLVRITEPSNDDFDNGVSGNCDHNFGTFDDFGVDQKVSHNMILMSKYKGQLGGKKGKQKSARGPPPTPERIFFI